MRAYVLGFQEVDRNDIGVVGGKGANLGELFRLEGIRVPDGFCVSTEAFKRVMGAAPAIDDLLDRLALLKGEDR
jgi:pyruvate,water dikinase